VVFNVAIAIIVADDVFVVISVVDAPIASVFLLLMLILLLLLLLLLLIKWLWFL
jgi:hypothetical protein